MIITICQGHSASRLWSRILQESGVWMGKPINASGDLVPEGWPRTRPPMYDAAAMANRRVKQVGPYRWNFTKLIGSRPPSAWWAAVYEHVHSAVQAPEPAGWKIPETLFSLPWLIHRFPKARYVYWLRDPRDVILGRQVVTDYKLVGIPHRGHPDPLMHRAIAWKYQHDLVEASPKPKHWLGVRFEDMALRQKEELERLSEFLGIPLKGAPIKEEAVYRHQKEGRTLPPTVLDLLRGGIEKWYE